MDIQRFYHLAYQEPVKGSQDEILKIGFHFLIMDTKIQGEFGVVTCRCVAQIESPFEFKFFFLETSGEHESNLFLFRQDCVRFFNTHILPMFNPLTRIKDEVSYSPSPES